MAEGVWFESREESYSSRSITYDPLHCLFFRSIYLRANIIINNAKADEM